MQNADILKNKVCKTKKRQYDVSITVVCWNDVRIAGILKNVPPSNTVQKIQPIVPTKLLVFYECCMTIS